MNCRSTFAIAVPGLANPLRSHCSLRRMEWPGCHVISRCHFRVPKGRLHVLGTLCAVAVGFPNAGEFVLSLFVFFINPLFYIHLYFLYTLLIMILYFSTFSYHTAFVISCTPLVHVCVFPFLFHFFSFHLYSPRFFSPINISLPLSSPTPAIPSSTPLFFIYLSFSLFLFLARPLLSSSSFNTFSFYTFLQEQ